MALGRLTAALRREAIERRLPHGVVHWCYLMPGIPEPLARQRELWWRGLPGVPRPLWALLQAWLWLRWQLWSGPSSVLRAVRRNGPRVREEEGIGLVAQARAVGAIALGWCVPPYEIYRHRLYRREDRARVAELVFDHTTPAYHRSLRTPGPDTEAGLALLADKERLAAELAGLGIPTVPTVRVVRRGEPTSLAALLTGGAPLFCKPRHGSAGAGAFAARLVGGVPQVQPLNGLPMAAHEAEAWWRALLERDDMLVQPRLSVHPRVAGAASDEDVVTLRLITWRAGPEVDVHCATLELPVDRDALTGRCRYVVLVADPADGTLGPFPRRYVGRAEAERQRTALDALSAEPVPGWDAVRDFSALAHRHMPGVTAIAWDWAITPSGPMLLEGNPGWSTAAPQQINGGLLRP